MEKQTLNIKLVGFMLLWFSIVFQASVFAAATAQQAGQANAGTLLRQVQQDISLMPIPPRTSIVLPKAAANVLSKMHHLKFVFSKISIEETGVDLRANPELSPTALERVFKPYYGKKISVAQLQKLVNTISDKFMASGYILSHFYLPAQRINNGHVKLNIVEGFVSRLAIIGDVNDKTKALVKRIFQPVLAARPLKNSALEHALLLLNKVPGVRGKGVLRADKKVPNASVLSIVLSRESKLIMSKLHNHTNALQPDLQAILGGSFYSGSVGGQTSIWANHGLGANSNGSKSVILSYQKMLSPIAGIITVNASWAESRPDYVASGQPFSDEKSAVKAINVLWSKPLKLGRRLSYTLQTEFDAFDSKTDKLDVPIGPLFNDKLRVVRLGLMSEFVDGLAGRGSIKLRYSQGVKGLGAAADSRTNALLDFNKVDLSFNRIQPLFKNLRWAANVTGQFTNDRLFASEEMSIGGNACGSGYDSGELIGDKAICMRNEFTYVFRPKAIKANIDFYLFHDIGEIWNNTLPLPQQLSNGSLASVGLGVRSWLSKHFFANLYVAKPLTKTVTLEGSKQARAFFSLTYQDKN